jgi:lipopolysaccharide transport system permease protein
MIGSISVPWTLTVDLARREVEKRYRGSFLGLAWVVLGPFLQLAIYTFVYSIVLRVQIHGMDQLDFVIWLYAGLSVFIFFSDVLSTAPPAIRDNRNYVKKVVFPLLALVYSRVLASLVLFGIMFGLLLVFVVAKQGVVHATVLLTPLLILPTVALACGVATLLASLGVFIRDLDEIIRPGLRVLFYLTPIAYPEALVPEQFRGILRMNPLTGLVDNYRRLIVFGTAPDWESLLTLTGLGVVALWVSFACFRKLRPGFADVV